VNLLLQCWAKVPTDRPTFLALKDFLSETLPPVMKATQKFVEADKMHIEPGDSIIVIDGRYLSHWHFCLVYFYKKFSLPSAPHLWLFFFLLLMPLLPDISAAVGHFGEYIVLSPPVHP